MDLISIHENCFKIFHGRLIRPDDNSNRSFACDIWDAMVQDGGHENCLGENFNQLVQTIQTDWFENYKPNENTRIVFYFYTYIFWLYLYIERIEFIINDIDPKQEFGLLQTYRKNWKTFDTIRIWANFIKHPKNFIFTHWPEYVFEGQKFTKSSDTVLVNISKLKDHYSSEKNENPKEFNNNSKIVVQLPKLDKLTDGFCDDFLSFIDLICGNKMLIDHLRKKTTL